MKGIIIHIGTTRSGTSQAGKTWQSTEFVIEWGGEHIEKAVLTTFKSENLAVGQLVDCQVNFKAREYQGKWYNSLEAWKVEVVGSSQPMQTYRPEAAQLPQQGTDDLPF